MRKKKIAFLWFGINGRYGVWRDGLWKAMKHIEKVHDVKYFDPTDDFESWNPDIILFWEALCTSQSKDKEMWDKVVRSPFKKALLFAGGPIKAEWAKPFDHIFVESKINADEFNALGITNSTAFGINEEIFYPKNLEKKYLGMHHGTCASWKRQWLIGEAIGDKGIVVGRYQDTDSYPFNRCKELGTTVLDEKTPEEISDLLNQSFTCLQTSDYWGGGQRCTLEALACNVPVVCMTDSPKNREYVEESGCGIVTDPTPQDISRASVIAQSTNWGNKGRDYVMSKWTSKHYADNLLAWINNCY